MVWNFTHIHYFPSAQADNVVLVISLDPLLRCVLLFLSVCCTSPHSLQTASLKLLFFSHSSSSASPFLSLSNPCIRSQSLRDGPVSSRFWTEWRRPESQKPFGARAQRNRKLPPSVAIPAHIFDSSSKFSKEHNHTNIFKIYIACFFFQST